MRKSMLLIMTAAAIIAISVLVFALPNQVFASCLSDPSCNLTRHERGLLAGHEAQAGEEAQVAKIIPGSLNVLVPTGFRWCLAGMFFVGVQLLQKYGYMSAVNWDKLGNDTSMQIQHWVGNIDVTNVHSLFHTLGIPVSSGLGLGLLMGFLRTH